MNNPRSWLAIGVSLVILAGGSWVFLLRQSSITTPVSLPPAQNYASDPIQSAPTSTIPNPSPVTTSSKPVIVPLGKPPATSSSTEVFPVALRLSVPFLSQAPKKDWAMPYQEACEEASALMVQAYYAGKQGNFMPEEGDQAILSLVDWAAQQYGPELVDMTAEQVATMVEGYMPELEAVVKSVTTAEDIKRELVKGNPVILPADGKRLENPRFRNGGPRYHMLVIKGYLEDGRWITNDPGTQFGENFLYSQANLLESARDWNGGDVPNGNSVMLVVTKKRSM